MVIVVSSAPPTQGIILQEPATKAFLDTRELGIGTLYITEERLIWREGNTPSESSSLSLMYPRISVHAVQRQPTACLYLMVDYEVNAEERAVDNGNATESENDDDFDPVESHITEVRFVPENTSRLPEMFQAMSRCQQLHPDPCESMSEEEQDGNLSPYDEEAEEEFEDAEGENNDVPVDEQMKDLSLRNGTNEANGHSDTD